jgi:hypothetical protein
MLNLINFPFFGHSLNTLRLWLPQIFQAMNDYQQFYNETSIDFCKSLEMIQPSNSTGECTVVSKIFQLRDVKMS